MINRVVAIADTSLEMTAGRIWVFTKQCEYSCYRWHIANKAEWVTKSDGRPISVKCEFSGFNRRIALKNIFVDTRNIIGKVVIPRMMGRFDEKWEEEFIEDLIAMEDWCEQLPPPAPFDDGNVFIGDGDDDDAAP